MLKRFWTVWHEDKNNFIIEYGGRSFILNIGAVQQTTRRHFPEVRNIYFFTAFGTSDVGEFISRDGHPHSAAVL
jgi:hypothetical protein